MLTRIGSIGRRVRRDNSGPVRHGAGAAATLLAILALVAPSPSGAAADDEVWEALRAGHGVALLRHAIAPGTGDPANFRIGDCSTQRNLSDAGRDQARRIGERFRENGIATARVYSSQWCRCLETAELLGLGPVEELPALNSFFRRSGLRGPQTRDIKEWLAKRDRDRPLVLVTHQVNITALSGVYRASGELVVIRRAADGTISVVGTIETD